jgi:L-alanine-DL-glutamate epimerase-like enolase superfamily enzyme
MAASLHLSLATRDAIILERVPATTEVQADLCDWPLELMDGHFLAPDVLGLGIDLTDEHLRRYRFIPGTGERN